MCMYVINSLSLTPPMCVCVTIPHPPLVGHPAVMRLCVNIPHSRPALPRRGHQDHVPRGAGFNVRCSYQAGLARANRYHRKHPLTSRCRGQGAARYHRKHPRAYRGRGQGAGGSQVPAQTPTGIQGQGAVGRGQGQGAVSGVWGSGQGAGAMA